MSNATLRRGAAHEPTVQLIPRRRPRRRLVIGLIVALVILGLIAGGLWAFGFSPLFATEQLAVTGTKNLSGSVKTTAQVPVGTPLARLDLAQIEARVETLKPVESATVTRDWPHTIRIEVVERVGIIGVRQPDGFLLVDRFGVGYAAASSLPKGLVIAEVDPGDQELLAATGVVAQALPESLKSKVLKIKATSRDTFELTLTKGRQVIWGSAEQSELKAQVIVALLKEKARTYDVSAPGSPTTR